MPTSADTETPSRTGRLADPDALICPGCGLQAVDLGPAGFAHHDGSTLCTGPGAEPIEATR